MKTFIGLLRAVNVGGHNKIKMAELRQLCQDMGFENPRTYIQSGNLIFRADQTDPLALARTLKKAIFDQFGVSCGVICIEPGLLERALENNPFPTEDGYDPKRVLFMFLENNPHQENKDRLIAAHQGPEKIAFGDGLVYLSYTEIARSKLTNVFLEKKLETTGTARNVKTALKLLDLARQVTEQVD